MTMSTLVAEWRIWVGPPWLPYDDVAAFNWTTLNGGSPSPDLTVPSSTLVIDLEPSVSQLTIANNASVWPAQGTVYVQGNATNEAIEVIKYGSAGQIGGNIVLGNLTRETITAEQNGHHTAGSSVSRWVLVPGTIDPVQSTEDSDHIKCTGIWTATVNGAKFTQGLLRNDHICIIEARFDALFNSTWGLWTPLYVGWIRNPHVTDDNAEKTEWQFTLTSLAELMKGIGVPGVHNGPINIAPAGRMQNSSLNLQTWYKMAWTGILPKAAPDLSFPMAIDRDPTTLCFSEHHIGSFNGKTVGETSNTRFFPDQIHISPYVGQPDGYRWIMFRPGASVRIWNSDGVAVVSNGEQWLSDHRADDRKGFSFVIMCENTDLFKTENPEYHDATLIELSDSTVPSLYDLYQANSWQVVSPGYTAKMWWDALDPAGGGLAMSCMANSNWECGAVIWGNVTPATLMLNWESGMRIWTGAVLAPTGLLPGQTIRRIWSGGYADASGYTASYVSEPGSYLPGADRMWFLLGLPGLNLSLAQPVTDSATTIYVQVGDTACSSGLPDSGVIQIGFEQISYTSKKRGTLSGCTRGYSGTTAAVHQANDQVLLFTNGYALDAKPVSKIQFHCVGGRPCPQEFWIYGYNFDNQPRTPDPDFEADTFYLRDYELIAYTNSNIDPNWSYTLPATKRYKWIHMTCARMTVDPARFEMNEFRVYIDTADEDADTCIPLGTTYDLVVAIAKLAGAPASAVVDSGGSTTLSGEFTSEPGPAWKVISDLADMSGDFIECLRDSRISVGGYRGNYTQGPGLVSKFDYSWITGHDVSQVQISWISPDGQTKGVAYYPTPPNAIGSVKRMGPRIYANSTAAQAGAQAEYFQSRRKYEAILDLAGNALYLRPGDQITATWKVDHDGPAMSRGCQISSVDEVLKGGAVETIAHLVQISGDDER